MAHPRFKSQVPGSTLQTFAKKEAGPTLRDRLRDALVSGTAGAYLGSMVLDGRVKVPKRIRKALKMPMNRGHMTIHGARVGGAIGAGLGISGKKPSKDTLDTVAGGGDWRFEDGKKPLTAGQKAALAGGAALTAGGLVLGTARGRNALRSAMAGGSAVRGLMNKAPGGNPRRVRLMKAQQKRKDLSNVRAAGKAVDEARAKFRAEALPKPPAEPTLADAVKTVKKRMKRKVVKAVSNIGANPAETQMSAYVEDMTFSGLPKEVQKDVLRFVDAEKGTPVVHYGMTVKELLGKADPENLKTARKALGTLRASRAAEEVLGKIKDGSKYILLMNDRIVDGHHFLAKAERAGITSSLNVLDLTPARLATRQMSAGERALWEFALLAYRTNPDGGTRARNSDPKKAQWKALLGNLTEEQKAKLEKSHQNQEAVQKTKRDVMGVAGGALVGQKLVREGRDRLTGRTTLYHGTDKETARKIKSGAGLKSADRAGTKGIADVVMASPERQSMLRKSRKGAFLSHEKGLHGAGQYAAQSAWLKEGHKPVMPADVVKVMEAEGKEKAKALWQVMKKKLSRDVMPITHRHKGKILKYRVPLWRKGVQKNLMPNPETEGFAGLLMDPGQRFMLDKRTKVFKNKVPEAYRVGSKNYKGVSRKEWMQYAKAHPKRMLKGAGLVAGGAGLLAGSALYGKKAWQERKLRNEKLKELSAVQALHHFAEEMRERRNRTRDLRDKIGLAKDVAGLGVVTGAGVGGVKLYRAAKKGIGEMTPQVRAAARAWHKAALKTGKTLDTVKDAVAPAAATNRGIRSVGGKIASIAKKATMWMHGDPRPVRTFEAPKRSKLQTARDAALTAAGVTVAGAGVASAMKAREAGKIADNIRNTTAIGSDVGRVYRKARHVAVDSVDAFKGGMREGLAKPAPRWAKRVVRIGKKLRLLEAGSQFPVRGSPLNEFMLGALGTIAGTLAGSAAGNKFRYPVQNWLKKKLGPKLGKTWGRRVARAGAYAPENAGALAGGAAGSFLTGGMRKPKAEEEQFSVPGSRLNQFGGREQLKDIDRSSFLDPLDVFIGRKKGYTAEQVKKYNREKNWLSDVKSGKKKATPEAIQAAEDIMRDIRGNPTKAAHGQVIRSALRKGDTVRKVTERGGGLLKDAAKELRGEAREKDRWGREKKREWEKPWFSRTKNQLIGAVTLGGGALALRKYPKVRAKMDRVIRVGQRKVNEYIPDFFPGVEPLRKKGQKTVATVQAKRQQAAQAKVAKTQAIVNQAGQNISQQAAAAKSAKPVKASQPKPAAQPASAPAAASPAPAPAKPAVSKPAASKPAAAAPAPASKPAAAKPADKSVRAPVKPAASSPAPAQPAASPWSASKLANEPLKPTAAEAAVKKAASQAKKPKTPKQGVSQPKKPEYDGKTGKWKFDRLLARALTQFMEKPFAGYNPKRHARTGGLNDSFRKSYNREHGSNLKRPVTTPPSKLKPGSEAAGRRKSFCARMSGMQGPTSKGGKLTPKGAALRRWNCAAIQALTQFADPLEVGWDIRDARGRSARVFAPDAGVRDRRPKRWHERVENERKLWAGAALTGTGLGAAAMGKLLGKQTKRAVDEALKRQARQIGAAVKKRYTVKRATGSGGGKAPNVVPFTPRDAA